MPEKPNNTKTIEISVETYNRLHSSKQQLSKIMHKNISFDTLFKLFYTVQPLEIALQDLILEEMPSIGFKKKPKEKEESESNGETDEESD